ncbi:g12243 [Coccomyxa viridis]|uniref:G12243 protein n=1 Tax=Coccomyxa viridis TaxID=1274662 RepID=A0ABP1GGX3_9CHLO
MDVDEAAKSLLSNTGLLAATVGVIAAIRVGNPKRSKGTCQSCGGRGVRECTLCYGKGYLVTSGYVNFADPRHRRLCRRCDGSKTVECTACDAGSRMITRSTDRRIQRSTPVEQQDDEF